MSLNQTCTQTERVLAWQSIAGYSNFRVMWKGQGLSIKQLFFYQNNYFCNLTRALMSAVCCKEKTVEKYLHTHKHIRALLTLMTMCVSVRAFERACVHVDVCVRNTGAFYHSYLSMWFISDPVTFHRFGSRSMETISPPGEGWSERGRERVRK